MITIENYFMGRDISHSDKCTADIRENAANTVELVNRLLDSAALDGVQPAVDPGTQSFVGSGWRPRSVNEATSNASATSKHLTGHACDLRDTADRALAKWCLANPNAMKRIGLWMEDPRWTPTWVHLQTLPPGSGKRVYIPSSAPPKCPPLPGQST